MQDLFHGYDWSGVKLLTVQRVRPTPPYRPFHRYGDTHFAQLGFKLTGKTDIVYGGKYLPYHAGSLLYLPKETHPAVPYDKTFPEPGDAICLFFDSDHPLPPEAMLFPAEKLSLSAEPFRKLLHTFEKSLCRNSFQCTAALYELFAGIESALDGAEREDAAFFRLRAAAEYMEQHFSDLYLDIEALASSAGMTPDYFRHQFRRVFRVGPLGYLNRLRLAEAQKLLSGTALSVGEIAARCGFADANYFSRFFRENIGQTPTGYRRRYSG